MITRNALTGHRTGHHLPGAVGRIRSSSRRRLPAAPPRSTIGGMPFTGDIEFGLMGVMGKNANQAGRYNGFNTTGLDGGSANST